MKNANKPTTIVLKRMPKDDETLAAQARVLLQVLSAKGGKLTLPELAQAAKGKLKTVQAVPAVFNHYRPALTKRGFIKMEAKATKGGKR